MRRWWWLITLAVALVALSGCGTSLATAGRITLPATPGTPRASAGTPGTPGTPAAGGAKTFVGKIEGTDAFIGIVSDGQHATAYVCDGTTIVAWFNGTVTDQQIALTDSDGRQLTASLNQTASGSTSLRAGGSLRTTDGAEHAFSSEQATGLDRAGLYTANGVGGDSANRLGVIVLSSGEHRGALWTPTGGKPVTDIAFSGQGVTAGQDISATVPSVGTFTAARLTMP
ncbi:MAG: hypothetical protein ACTHMP_14545 [Thermomicrobiales bacterium]